MSDGPNVYSRLFRGETSFDFAGRWRRWFAISGLVILIGFISLGVRGLNFSIDFKGGTTWEVPTTASVSQVRGALGGINGFGSQLSQATIQNLTDRQTNKRIIKVEAPAKATANSAEVASVTTALAKLGHVNTNEVQLNDIGPSWGSDITNKAVRAVIIFLVVVSAYIWLRFEAKMALAALVALIHDILVTVGIYSLSGFQVSPDTVIAFLTILGYSLYDTIVVFDKVQENTRGLASTGRYTYTETVNVSMNQVLARSINTSFVAIIPILSVLVIGAGVLGASALEDFGLALFIGLTTGAYSSIFIASPLVALLKESEPRYAQIRSRLDKRTGAGRLTPAAVAAEAGNLGSKEGGGSLRPDRVRPPRPTKRPGGERSESGGDRLSSGDRLGSGAANGGTSPARQGNGGGIQRRVRPVAPVDHYEETGPEGSDQGGIGPGAGDHEPFLPPTRGVAVPPRSNRPPPRPRKKRRR
ncbi:MAG: protein translocase subunit SecF [Actinomycetota bacterium]|nr:protein translocase subunit SecF [Actinomycetota bacterium]